MYQRTIKSLEIELKMLQRENQALQQWQPQQEQHLKRLIDQLLQQKCQHQGQQQQQQQQEEEELIGNMQKLTQNQQRQDLIENQSHDQQRSDLRGQKYEFIQSQQRRDQNQKIVHGEMKNSMQKQQELQKEGKILQIQSQIQEKKDEGWQWNHGTGNFDQNTLKKQRNGKAEALRPHAPTISSLLKINVDRVPDHRTDGSGSRSGRPEIQNISPGIQSAAASPGASVVNGQRGILPNVKGKGASNRENLVGNTSQQQQGVPRLPVRLGGIAGSSDHNGGSEAGEANWDEKHWNAKKRVNGSEPVDYELEELDKSGYHLDDYENKE